MRFNRSKHFAQMVIRELQKVKSWLGLHDAHGTCCVNQWTVCSSLPYSEVVWDYQYQAFWKVFK